MGCVASSWTLPYTSLMTTGWSSQTRSSDSLFASLSCPNPLPLSPAPLSQSPSPQLTASHEQEALCNEDGELDKVHFVILVKEQLKQHMLSSLVESMAVADPVRAWLMFGA